MVALALALVGWAYAGYPLWCATRARLFPRPLRRASIRPSVTVVVAARRESATIAAKLQTLSAQHYPKELLSVVIAVDGGDDDDRTVDTARASGTPLFGDRLQVLALPRRGKPHALNAAVAAADGEVLIFTDARQQLDRDAIRLLVEDLGDPAVGAVGGRLLLDGGAPVSAYWRYESKLREWEGRSGSTVGVSGALYALRRRHWRPLPEETILDDLLVPSRVRLDGARVAYEPRAIAWDHAARSRDELGRKIRTLSGNFQLLLLLPSLLSPFRNPSWGDFVSHKLLRLVVPWALLVALVGSALLPARIAVPLCALQLAAWLLAVLRLAGALRSSRLAGLCETFAVLNAAAVAGFARFVRHGRRLPW
jgi:cellulose synthase/poly-beta-1,6-N-acetylglucosamine synthase-like glycosyltransferase